MTVTYDIRRSLSGQDDWTVIDTGIVLEEYLSEDLEPDTSYDFQVRACNEHGCSDWSVTVNATTQPAPEEPTVLPMYVWTGTIWAQIGYPPESGD